MKGIGIILAALVLALVLGAAPVRAQGPGPVVVLETSKGTIMVLLDPVKAPVSVGNFLKYIKGFMIQGGGFDTSLRVKPTMAPIRNESGNGLENRRGTIAMARTNDLDSATSQFYINHVDNAFLDTNKYCVFGKVLRGMNVVDAIADVPTGNQGGMADVPREQVVILRAYRHQG